MTGDRLAQGPPGGPPELPEDLISAYLDDELDEAARAAVDAALVGSPELRASLAGIRSVRDAVRALPLLDVPTGLWESPAVPSLDRARARRPRRAAVRWIAAATAAAAVTAVLAMPARDPVTPDVAGFTDAHAVRSSVGNDAISTLSGAAIPTRPGR
jgi:anti-sigma factor RsiW